MSVRLTSSRPLHDEEKRSIWPTRDLSIVPSGQRPGPLIFAGPCGYESWVDCEIIRPGVVRWTGKYAKFLVKRTPGAISFTFRAYRIGCFTIGFAWRPRALEA